VGDTSDSGRVSKNNYAGMVLLPWIFGMLAFWIIVIADPYHLRPDGSPFRLADHRYPDLEWPRLIGVSTASPHDVVLLGGSTGMPVTPEMMREAFGAQSPLNLSYLAPRPLDMPLILPKIAQIRGLKHVILFMDFSLMEKDAKRSPTGVILESMAATSWSHRADFSLSTALASLHALATGVFDLSYWATHQTPDYMFNAEPLPQSASIMHRFKDAVQRHAADVFDKSSLTCDQLPYLQGNLAPFLRQMAAKHVAVDLVFPALPYVLNYDWIERRPPSNDTLLPGPVFDQFMVFKSCVIAVRDEVGVQSTRVLALDANESLSGNIGRYLDTIHLLDPEAYRIVAHMIADENDAIDSNNIKQHEADLRIKIERSTAQLETN
jgi:hypothetical protein